METKQLIISFTSYPDGSGAPAVAACYGNVYALEFIAGEVKVNAIRSNNALGNRAVQIREAGLNRIRDQYMAMIKDLGPEWLELNVKMYG